MNGIWAQIPYLYYSARTAYITRRRPSSLVRSLESPQLFPYAIHTEVSIPIHSFEFPHLMSVSSTRSRLV